MKRYLAIGGLVLVTVIWGGGFVASDMALESLRPFQIMAVRFLLASVLMGAISVKSLKGISHKEIRAGALMGVALFAGFALQIVGLQYTTPSKNAFLTALNVVMVPFIAWVILKKKIGAKSILGAVMAIVGVGLLSLEKNFTLGLGDALTLICAVGFAFQIFFTSEFVKQYRAAVLNFVQMCTAFVLSLVSLFAFGELHFEVTAKGWLSVLYLGVVSTTICYLLQTACQKYVDETKAAIILSMESVFGTLFSILILHEQITLRMVAGCVIILTAVIISNLAEGQETENVKEISHEI
ncbi:MAG: DMT family transporter [Coprococcus sp.]|nr:DMT family transporter [Coprococcus sp.]